MTDDQKESLDKFVIEIASLSHEAKGEKIRDYLRAHMNCKLPAWGQLGERFQIHRDTLRKWMKEIRDSVEPEPLDPASSQGMPLRMYPLAAATRAKSILLGSARGPIQIHPPLHGYASMVASAADGTGSQVFIVLFRPCCHT
jgi:hypothetical protein